MASSEMATKTDNKRCFCALCTNSFPLQEDNLYRRRNLHDLCRMMESFPISQTDSTKQDELFLLLEDQLKKRKLISLCNRCNIMVGALLREREIAKEYEGAVIRQHQNLRNEMAGLQHHNLAVAHHFSSIKDAVESSHAEDFKFSSIREIEDGIKVFRDRLIEIAKGLESYCLGVQNSQMALETIRNQPAAISHSVRPFTFQNQDPNPGTSASFCAAVFQPTAERNNQCADNESELPTKRRKMSSPVETIAFPKPDFKERLISRAQKKQNDSNAAVGQPASFGCNLIYDKSNDRLSFCDVMVTINSEERNLQCGDCGQKIKQNPKKPGEFYNMEKSFKSHVLHKHFNVWEFNCKHCNQGFAKKNLLERHETKCVGVGAAVNVGPEDDDKMEEDVDMCDTTGQTEAAKVSTVEADAESDDEFYKDLTDDEDFEAFDDDDVVFGGIDENKI